MNEWRAVTRIPDVLGESPFWHPIERALYWIDIPARQLRRMDPGGIAESWEMPSEPGCIAPVETGGLMIALRDGVYFAAGWGGTLETVVRFNYDTSTTRFNDGKADPEGRFWAGTIYEPKDARKAELYSVDLRPENGNEGRPVVQLKAQNATTANGLAWSADARTVYWADTPSHAVYAWDWDPATNAMRHHRVFHQFAPKPSGWKPGQPGYGGRPDGAAVDSQGNYWCSLFEGQRLARLSPQGDVVAEIELPARCPTMPCFGGKDLRTLYVTTAREKRPADELETFPLSGHVFAMDVDVPGLPVNFVRT
ncbi:MAG TPA: SMP-30/gluconolactonase/LRE family protein [Ramlibacter sp.]|jgi:sugar lactone lactonase YvrE|nr:SMP-30/gluconolactonase/LRE family protein [Ramlibacter sp.]